MVSVLRVSEIILGVTAIILLCYTFDTRTIAIPAAQKQKLETRPEVALRVLADKGSPLDVRVRLTNYSYYKVAVLLIFSIRVNDIKLASFKDAYDGKEYWIVRAGLGRGPEGHFALHEVLLKADIISKSEFQDIEKSRRPKPFEKCVRILKSKDEYKDKFPEIWMDIDMHCANELAKADPYDQSHYYFSFVEKTWVPVLTTTTKPSWAKFNQV